MNPLPGALTAGLLALALAGCTTATGSGGPQASRPDASQGPGVALASAAVPAAADGNPERLRDLDPDAVAQLIGMPNYVRRDGGVTVWQYHAGVCVMDLFWYPTPQGTRLAHYEVRGLRLASVAEPRSCFNRLLLRRRDAATS